MLVWADGVRLLRRPPSLAPLKQLSLLVLEAKTAMGEADMGLDEDEVMGLVSLLSGPQALQQVRLHLDLTTWGAWLHKTNQVAPADAGDREQLPNPVRGAPEQPPDPAVGRAVLFWLASLLHHVLRRLERLQLGSKFVSLPLSKRSQEAVFEMLSGCQVVL
jgi:hypothetical protein